MSRPSFFHHLHPPSIPARQSRFRYTLGAGGLSVFLLLVLLVTGALEMFYYLPTPQGAAESIQTLTFLVPFGGFVRNLHYWAAQLLVGVALVHLLRVIFTGAYAPPRRLNYLIGLGLLALSLFLDFTGYVLRWDEGIHWALVAGTNLVKSIPALGPGLYRLVAGGEVLGEATLIRFYAWHVFGLTLAIIIFGAWHIFRVRRDGGIAVPPPDQRRKSARISRYELVRREGLAALLVACLLFLLAFFVPAPLAPPIGDPTAAAIDARAPWFFLWVQGALRLGNPFLWGVLLPIGVLLLLALIPYLLPTPDPKHLGRWLPPSGRAAQALAAALVLLALGFTGYALLNTP
jgi:quinol-cytochrome oxidoreductase complex cytochrome b subunit